MVWLDKFIFAESFAKTGDDNAVKATVSEANNAILRMRKPVDYDVGEGNGGTIL